MTGPGVTRFLALSCLGLFVSSHGARAAVPTEIRVLDSEGQEQDVRQLRASLSRTLPVELGELPGPDRDALSFLLAGPPDSALEPLTALTVTATGRPLDVIVRVPTEPATCPEGIAPELVCRRTPPLRLVGEPTERHHPALQQRSLLAEVGGALRVSLGARTLLELPVGGPRGAALGPTGRLHARLRPIILRARAGGGPAIGGSDEGARKRLREELAAAAAIWGQCGIELGAIDRLNIEVVDPPTRALLTVGCGLAQPASGGELRLRSGRRVVSLVTRAGESPASVALRFSELLGSGATAPEVFENQRALYEPVPSADLLLPLGARFQRDGSAPLSSDPTLSLCLSSVDLNDGLTHFRDGDAFSGTLEERALLRAFDDGDPASIEVFVVPELEGGQRIGESFIVSSGSSLSSSVIIDRSAISAGARSFALAHELGHVLLALPGHPDDFGVDQSWSLMDADVADATIFGPRRLSVRDCERAFIESGPNGTVRLLEPVPLRPAPGPARAIPGAGTATAVR